MKGYILVAIAFCLFGCNEDSNPVAEKTADSTVYIAWRNGYWKNGVQTILNTSSDINSMWVDGSSVLIGGMIPGNAARNVIWKDGEETVNVEGSGGGVTLVASHDNNLFGVWYQAGGWVLYKNGTTTLIKSGWVTALSILKDDAYLAGDSQGNDYPWGVSDFYPLDTYAQCWKNEQLIFKENVHSYANTIFIHGDDIYLGGHLNHYPSLDRVACYWKNGARITLTEEDRDAEVNALFVTGDHVYAAGTINDQAVYWKDGVVTNLSNGITSSRANSISVLGTDVYVAGQEDKYPAVWKNGVKQILPDQEKQGGIKIIVVVSNKIN